MKSCVVSVLKLQQWLNKLVGVVMQVKIEFGFEFDERRLLIPRASFLAHGGVRVVSRLSNRPCNASPKTVIVRALNSKRSFKRLFVL